MMSLYVKSGELEMLILKLLVYPVADHAKTPASLMSTSSSASQYYAVTPGHSSSSVRVGGI